nr:acetyltransferase [Vibrio cholerae]
MVSAVVCELSVMRCQPLRRALVALWKNHYET